LANVVGNGVSRIIMDADGEQATVTNNRLDVNATIGLGSTTFTSYAQFTAATSPTALSDSSNGINATVTDCKEIIIQPDFDNTGHIMIGSSGATSETNGIRLNAGDTLILPVSSTANVYIDASGSSQLVNVSIIR
tara:strand:+ start:2318 stop:2722 length:405 start_codon:yes stop_codon:yes gene_type:complete